MMNVDNQDRQCHPVILSAAKDLRWGWRFACPHRRSFAALRM